MATNYHVRTFKDSIFPAYPNNKVTQDELLVMGELTRGGLVANEPGVKDVVSSYLNLFAYQYPNPLYGLKLVGGNYSVEEKQTTMTSWGYRNGFNQNVKFNGPSDLVRVGDYIIIGDNTRLRKYNIYTGEVTTINIWGPAYEEYLTFEEIKSLCYDGTYLYFTDYFDFGEGNRSSYILKCTLPENLIGDFSCEVLAGYVEDGDGIGYVDADLGINAKFLGVSSLSYHNGYLYICDVDKLRRLNLATTEVDTLKTSFTNLVGSTCTNGKVYLSDSGAQTISEYVIDTDALSVVMTSTSTVDLANDGTSLFFTDGNIIKKATIGSYAVTTLSGSSSSGYLDGEGVDALFYEPESLEYYSGDLYVCDTKNGMLRRVNLKTNYTSTPAGGLYSSGSSAYFAKNSVMSEGDLKDFLCTTFEANKSSFGLDDVTDMNMVWFWFTIEDFPGNEFFTVFWYVGNDENNTELIYKGGA